MLFDPVDFSFATVSGRRVVSIAAAGITHDILSATHTDSTAAAVVRGDIIIGSGATPKWTRLARSVPAANVLNVLGLANGDLEPAWKTVLDATNPASVTLSATPGTSLVLAHRDHGHALDVTISPTWTGVHVFSGSGHTALRVQSSGANQAISLQLAGRNASADYVWYLSSRGGVDAPANRLAFFNNTPAEVGYLTTDGVLNVLTGFRVNAAAAAGNILVGDGTNYAPVSTAGINFTPAWSATTGSISTAGSTLIVARYMLHGNKMSVTIGVIGLTLSGGPSQFIYLTIPASKTAAHYWYGKTNAVDTAVDLTTATIQTVAGDTRIYFRRDFRLTTNWANGTNTIDLFGELEFDVS